MNKIENKINSTKFNVCKNFLKYMIAPIVLLLVGIILLCTVGFNSGADFKGSSTFTIFANSHKEIALANQYDLSKDADVDAFVEDIEEVLNVDNLDIVRVQKTTMDIDEPMIRGAEALKITFVSSKTDREAIQRQNEAIKQMLVDKFYSDYENAVSSVDYIAPSFDYGWLAGVLGAALSAAVVALAYFAIRQRSFVVLALGFIQIAVDIVLSLALIAICRVPFNLTIAIILATTMLMSVLNVFLFTDKSKENITAGKYAKMSNQEMAELTVKELAYKKIIAYIALLLISILFIALAENSVRVVALGILLSLVASFYTSNFLLPVMWAGVYKERKAKKRL